MSARHMIVLAALLVAGCSSAPSVTIGEVVRKDHTPAWTQVLIMPVSSYNGRSTTITMIPMFIFHPDTWSVQIYGITADGQPDYETFYVPERVYDDVLVGQTFEYDPEICDMDPPREERRRATADERRRMEATP